MRSDVTTTLGHDGDDDAPATAAADESGIHR